MWTYDGGDKDCSKDQAGLSNTDTFGESLTGVEGCEEGERETSEQDGAADEEEVEDVSASHDGNVSKCYSATMN